MSLREEAYDVLRENLVAVRPEFAAREVVLCPICQREISRDAVIRGGIEHILPQNVVKGDSADLILLGTKNQRCGITILCRDQRVCKSDGKISKDGCNGIKGRLYDRLFRGLFDTNTHTKSELRHSHGVAILIMAYLGAFQTFGYEYILRPELDPIREQFDFPNDRKTDWLDHACYGLAKEIPQVVSTSHGQPFLFGSISTLTAQLEVFFRRCHVILPGGHLSLRKATRHLEVLLPEDLR